MYNLRLAWALKVLWFGLWRFVLVCGVLWCGLWCFVVVCGVLWCLVPPFLGAAIFDCIIRSCDLFYWFIRTCLGPTVVPATITSLELVCVLTMCYFSDNVSSKENNKILWLIFMFYYGDIIAIKNSYWFFSFT